MRVMAAKKKSAGEPKRVETRGKGSSSPNPKSRITRERILRAARRVFAEHPYKAASIRMIGRAGGFDHPLIHYYYPSKAELFEAVVAESCDEYYRANLSWFDGLERMPPEQGLSLYLDRLLGYCLRNPEPLRIIMLNAANIDRLEEIPGYHHIPELLAKNREVFEKRARLRASSYEIGMFIHSFNSLIVFYIGAAPCQAAVLGMDLKSDQYRSWVKKTMLYIFLPRLEKLIFPEQG